MNNGEIDDNLIDNYVAFLQKKNRHVFTCPAFWVNSVLLKTMSTKIHSLKGFAFKKAMSMPWKYTILEAIERLPSEHMLAAAETAKVIINFWSSRTKTGAFSNRLKS